MPAIKSDDDKMIQMLREAKNINTPVESLKYMVSNTELTNLVDLEQWVVDNYPDKFKKNVTNNNVLGISDACDIIVYKLSIAELEKCTMSAKTPRVFLQHIDDNQIVGNGHARETLKKNGC